MYQYKVENFIYEFNLQEKLNEFSAEGWKCISVFWAEDHLTLSVVLERED